MRTQGMAEAAMPFLFFWKLGWLELQHQRLFNHFLRHAA